MLVTTIIVIATITVVITVTMATTIMLVMAVADNHGGDYNNIYDSCYENGHDSDGSHGDDRFKIF